MTKICDSWSSSNLTHVHIQCWWLTRISSQICCAVSWWAVFDSKAPLSTLRSHWSKGIDRQSSKPGSRKVLSSDQNKIRKHRVSLTNLRPKCLGGRNKSQHFLLTASHRIVEDLVLSPVWCWLHCWAPSYWHFDSDLLRTGFEDLRPIMTHPSIGDRTDFWAQTSQSQHHGCWFCLCFGGRLRLQRPPETGVWFWGPVFLDLASTWLAKTCHCPDKRNTADVATLEGCNLKSAVHPVVGREAPLGRRLWGCTFVKQRRTKSWYIQSITSK